MEPGSKVTLQDMLNHIRIEGIPYGITEDSTFEDIDAAIAKGMSFPFELDFQWWADEIIVPLSEPQLNRGRKRNAFGNGGINVLKGHT